MKKLIPIAVTFSLLTGVGIYSIDKKLETAKAAETVTLNQDKIHSKMLNSIDNFKSAQGTFVYKSKAAGFNHSVDYKIQTRNGNRSNVKIKDSVQEINTVYDGQTLVQTFPEKESYEELKIDEKVTEEQVKSDKADKSIESRYDHSKNEKVYNYRTDPTYMSAASVSLFPQEIAVGFLEDYSKWEISGHMKYLGQNAVIISGTFNEYYAEKHQADTFKLWVDENRGIILKLEEYGKDNEVMTSLETTKFKADSSFHSSDFKANVPAKYKKKKSPFPVE